MAQSALKSYYEDLTPAQELALPRPLFERIPGDETQLGTQTFRTPIIAMAMETARQRLAALPAEEEEFYETYIPDHNGDHAHRELDADFPVCN